MELETKIILALAVLIMGTITAYAIAPAGVTWISDTSYTPGAATASDVTEGGNITVLNITGANQSTERWAGYLGNISSAGSLIILANDATPTDVFYNWSWDSAQGGEVCAGTATSYTWASLEAAAATDLDSTWGFGDVSDDAEATFNDGTSTFEIGGASGSAPMADTGFSGGYETFLLEDTPGASAETDFLFCSNISAAGTGYDGTTVDYELIVPTTYGAHETYYFYLDVN